MIADAAGTKLCTYLSAILLVGLVLDATLHWWWADPVAALGIAFLAVREGGKRGRATIAVKRNVRQSAPVMRRHGLWSSWRPPGCLETLHTCFRKFAGARSLRGV